MITPAQTRAARGLLGWSRDELCAVSSVPMRTLSRFEQEEHVPQAITRTALRVALEAAGVEFIPANGGGQGVRFKAKAD